MVAGEVRVEVVKVGVGVGGAATIRGVLMKGVPTRFSAGNMIDLGLGYGIVCRNTLAGNWARSRALLA